MKRHLRLHIVQAFHQEVCRAHPKLESSEGMLHGAAPHRHYTWGPVQPVLGGLQNGFMLPTFNAALPAGGAFFFERTGGAGRGPVIPHDLAVFFVGEAVG